MKNTPSATARPTTSPLQEQLTQSTVLNTTDCGLTYEHTWHGYKTPRGKIKICDGTFRENKK